MPLGHNTSGPAPEGAAKDEPPEVAVFRAILAALEALDQKLDAVWEVVKEHTH